MLVSFLNTTLKAPPEPEGHLPPWVYYILGGFFGTHTTLDGTCSHSTTNKLFPCVMNPGISVTATGNYFAICFEECME